MELGLLIFHFSLQSFSQVFSIVYLFCYFNNGINSILCCWSFVPTCKVCMSSLSYGTFLNQEIREIVGIWRFVKWKWKYGSLLKYHRTSFIAQLDIRGTRYMCILNWMTFVMEIKEENPHLLIVTHRNKSVVYRRKISILQTYDILIILDFKYLTYNRTDHDPLEKDISKY